MLIFTILPCIGLFSPERVSRPLGCRSASSNNFIVYRGEREKSKGKKKVL
jgi:hypothetical protein